MTTTTTRDIEITPSPFLLSFKAARRAGTPILRVTSPDPAQTIRTIVSSFNGTPPPCIAWNIMDGVLPLNEPGKAAAAALGDVDSLAGLFAAMRDRLAPRSIMFVMNAHRYVTDGPTGRPDVTQALWNLRDAFKADGRTVILLGPEFSLPSELRNDVVALDEPRPDATERAEIARGVLGDEIDAATIAAAVDATAGLSSFLAEQNIAMSVRESDDGVRTLDASDLWQRQRAALETTPGMIVEQAGLGFDDVGGLDGIKARIRARINGPRRPRVIVRIDEIDKQMSGGGGGLDTNETSKDQVGVLLKEMDDRGYTGFVAYGGPGTGKTRISNTIAKECGAICITLDLPALLDKWVGSSQSRIREFFRVLYALAGQDGALFIATCNRVEPILPEVRRRFKLGTYCFDRPSAAELDVIWTIQLKSFGLPLDSERPACDGWTGADVRNACEEAVATGLPVSDAAQFIIPIGTADPAVFEKVRTASEGRYYAASYPGVFTTNKTPTTAGPRTRRALAKD